MLEKKFRERFGGDQNSFLQALERAAKPQERAKKPVERAEIIREHESDIEDENCGVSFSRSSEINTASNLKARTSVVPKVDSRPNPSPGKIVQNLTPTPTKPATRHAPTESWGFDNVEDESVGEINMTTPDSKSKALRELRSSRQKITSGTTPRKA